MSGRRAGMAQLLYRYTPDGVEERRIEFPAKKVSSVIFGGDDLSDLYITTALTDGTKSEEGAGAGASLPITTGYTWLARVLLTGQNLRRVDRRSP